MPRILLNTFTGNGSQSDPYLIDDFQDIINLSKLVEDGIDFNECYFLQTNDIDMEGAGWFPIGTTETPFAGVYNGNGHSVKNLYVTNESSRSVVSGLFGYVSGAIVNLGIESGTIEGAFCGSIAAKSVGENAAIINCYSKANIDGEYAGGIAYNFARNVVACCWYDGILNGNEKVVAWSLQVEMLRSIIVIQLQGLVSTADVDSPTSAIVVEQELLYSSLVARNLNLSVGLAQFPICGEL